MILVTHTDLDGVGAEIVARNFYPELNDEKVYHCDYCTVNERVRKLLKNTDEEIWLTDISVNPETAALIDLHYADRVRLYDHHQSAEAYLKGYSWCVIDTSRSGTQLFFDSLCQEVKIQHRLPQALPLFVFYVNDYDLWHHAMPYSSDLNDLMHLLGRKRFTETMMSRLHNNEPLILEQDQLFLDALLEQKERQFKERVERAVIVDNRLVVVANSHLSELSEYIRNIDPPKSWEKLDYIDMVNVETGSHSLRSYNQNFDVSLVAQKYGGGGHKNAAGYMGRAISMEELKEL